MGIVEKGLEFNINCHGLRVDVFFLYNQSNGTWYAGHRPRLYLSLSRYHHPDFPLFCYASGHKVFVPCRNRVSDRHQYGSNWMAGYIGTMKNP
ncbi:fukutin [Trichonephila inaurata madagascariensis]|uniref:Fukutin n=1 Tax=Trichonephila inaurata madagascariensis TaxID=2747483 RepID=A0A8X7C6S4_9ARAC|nr:fukutin [Trichonephila inaurata madagascariensis]